MKPPIEHIRLSQQARDQLIKLKRITGIQHWNILCRWAFCESLSEPSIPLLSKLPSDSNLEMTWKVFGGDHADLYAALIVERCRRDGLGTDPTTCANYFRLHLHRGLGYLSSNKKLSSISSLLERVTTV